MLKNRAFLGIRSWEKGRTQLVFLFITGVVLIFGLYVTERPKRLVPDTNSQLKIEAAETMQRAIEVIKNHKIDKHKINPHYDPNFTGLIGKEFTPTTTSIGNLAAKRTATNSDWAAVLVDMFMELGVEQGDIVAAGVSASFPGLIIATMSAAKVMGLKLILISSIGSSQWGANDPEFSWLDMENLLFEKHIFPYRSIAVSMGGDADRGTSYFGNEEEIFTSIIQRGGLPFIYEENLTKSIRRRIELYDEHAQGGEIKVFVNIGGASANVGACNHSLRIPNGIQRNLPACSHSNKGAIFYMAERGIPLIHLLNIRDLAFRYRVPLDPIPLPETGQSRIYHQVNQIPKNREK